MSDEYYYLQNKSWKSITYDWDILSRYGNTSRAYCLTDFQAAWLLSTTGYMAWSTRWKNCPCTEQDLIDMKAELDYRLMECVDIQPYQLQYIYDSGQAAELDELQALWDADPNPSSVNPLTPDDYYSGDDSQDRLDALCTACKIYVYSYAQNWVQKAQIALGIVAVVGLAASITVVGGIIASVLVGGLAYITSLALTAMQDKDALNDVACCMYNYLTGKAITNANFLTCLDGCGFTEGSNAAIVRDIVASDLTQFKNWLTFINQIGDSYEYATYGIIDCPCGDGTWEHTFDFEVSDGGWTPSDFGWSVSELATYVPSSGWSYVNTFDGVGSYRRVCGIQIDFADTTITEIEMSFNYTKGSVIGAAGTTTAWNIVESLDAANQANNPVNYNSVVNGTPTTHTLTAEHLSDQIRVYASSSYQSSATYSGVVLIKSITVRGIGTNPF